ncbi:MAG: acyltransferase [Spirosomataceae bacterium]
MSNSIHVTADVQSAKIGLGTKIWQFVVVLPEAEIGNDCNICSHCFIENDVKIGDGVTVKSGVQIWDGVSVGDNVFIGPNVTFTNDLLPRSKQYPSEFERTIVEEGASIGANATIIAGVRIGKYTMIGAGSVLTKSTPAFSLWYGNPAKQHGYVTKEGIVLDLELRCKNGNKYEIVNDIIKMV